MGFAAVVTAALVMVVALAEPIPNHIFKKDALMGDGSPAPAPPVYGPPVGYGTGSTTASMPMSTYSGTAPLSSTEASPIGFSNSSALASSTALSSTFSTIRSTTQFTVTSRLTLTLTAPATSSVTPASPSWVNYTRPTGGWTAASSLSPNTTLVSPIGATSSPGLGWSSDSSSSTPSPSTPTAAPMTTAAPTTTVTSLRTSFVTLWPNSTSTAPSFPTAPGSGTWSLTGSAYRPTSTDASPVGASSEVSPYGNSSTTIYSPITASSSQSSFSSPSAAAPEPPTYDGIPLLPPGNISAPLATDPRFTSEPRIPASALPCADDDDDALGAFSPLYPRFVYTPSTTPWPAVTAPATTAAAACATGHSPLQLPYGRAAPRT